MLKKTAYVLLVLKRFFAINANATDDLQLYWTIRCGDPTMRQRCPSDDDDDDDDVIVAA